MAAVYLGLYDDDDAGDPSIHCFALLFSDPVTSMPKGQRMRCHVDRSIDYLDPGGPHACMQG
jgi:hypothetical protein